MKSKLCLAVLLIFPLFAFCGTSVTLREHKNLVGDKRIPHEELSAEQVALKHCVASGLCDWASLSETMPSKAAKICRDKNLSPESEKARENNLKANHRYEVLFAEVKGKQASVEVEEQINGGKNWNLFQLKKTSEGWIVAKEITIGKKDFSGLSFSSVTLKDNKKLTGKDRIPHKELPPELVALKNIVAFELYDWEAYSETLPEAEAKKWRNKKLTPGLQKTRERSLEANPRFTLIGTGSGFSLETFRKDFACIVEDLWDSDSLTGRYLLILKPTSSGWVVTSFMIIYRLNKWVLIRP